jgi:hypothetical protein
MYDYHDATLKCAILDWETGTTTLTFALCAEPERHVTVTILETIDLKCERQFPWGKSFSVNRLDLQTLDSGHRLELEMQSGDRIVIIGKAVSEKLAD